MVSCRKRCERNLIVATLQETFLARFHNLLSRTFTDRTIRHSCLAKPTSTSTTTLNLKRQSVLNNLGIRNNALSNRVSHRKIWQTAFIDYTWCAATFFRNRITPACSCVVVHNLIKQWYVNALNLRQPMQNLLARNPIKLGSSYAFAHLYQCFFTITQKNCIKKRSHRF